MSDVTARTRLLVLLGEPVDHSLSPDMQNAACRAAGVDAVYVALRVDSDAVPALLRALARAGAAGNVTIPHKTRVLGALDRTLPDAARTGACNTFWLQDGGVCGDNTDVRGFRRAASALVGSPAGARVLLLGAGGAARAALCGLVDEGADRVDVIARSAENAQQMIRDLGAASRAALTGADAVAREVYDLVVNATPLGMHPGDAAPLDVELLRGAPALLDLVYARGKTRLVRQARVRGLRAADGREMLLQQGAASFERWWGMPAPIDAMRAALEA